MDATPISIRPRIGSDHSLPSNFRPLPLEVFFLKVFERCNLACRYCYMYEMKDQSWQSRPNQMSMTTFEQTAARIGEHVRAHQIDEISLTFHGGEPLMRGAEFFEHASKRLRSELGDTKCQLRVQTNATLLTEPVLRTMKQNNIQVGVSLDGNREANDRHRLTKKGQSTYDRSLDGLRILTRPEFKALFWGVLCVVDLRNDPIETYESLASLSPPMIEFLLPHANWDAPPQTGYADWLIDIFDRWFELPESPKIRLFHDIMSGCLGGVSGTQGIGLSPMQLTYVDTDGAIQRDDVLKSAYEGAAETGLNVFSNSFDEALVAGGYAERQNGIDGLCSKCRQCDMVAACGGGAYAHRFDSSNGFDNPSAYCPDLFRLTEHIYKRVCAEVKLQLRRV
jgi:uncharacterized protein